MKKIFYICIAALAVAATGCKQEKDIDLNTYGGKGLEFIHFENSEESWLVTENDESYDFSLVVAITSAPAQDVTYNVSLGSNTTGEEGKDFSIANKSVTIKAGEYTGVLPVKVLYDTTGEGFVIELELDVDESLINPAYGSTAIITVKSDKVTIDWDWLVGNWNSQDYSYSNAKNDGDPYTVAISKTDETSGVLNGLWGGGPLNFTVDFDAKTLTIPGYQYSFSHAGYGADIYFVAVDPDAEYDLYDDVTTPVVATLSPVGIVVDNYDMLLVGGQYDGYTWVGGVKSTLTR